MQNNGFIKLIFILRRRFIKGCLHLHAQYFHSDRKYTKQIVRQQIPPTIKIGIALKIK
jgi:hypothetical protein